MKKDDVLIDDWRRSESRVMEAYPLKAKVRKGDNEPHYVVPWEMVNVYRKKEKQSSISSGPVAFF